MASSGMTKLHDYTFSACDASGSKIMKTVIRKDWRISFTFFEALAAVTHSSIGSAVTYIAGMQRCMPESFRIHVYTVMVGMGIT